jgi:hypothetical protein
MLMDLSCECGQTTTVTEGSADVTIHCDCGACIRIPPFRRRLARCAGSQAATAQRAYPPAIIAFVLGGIYGVGSILLSDSLLWFASGGGSAKIGYAMSLFGQIWLVYLIVWECHPEAIVWSLLVPFFTWYFAYQRWDIAKWAFLANLGGTILFLAGIV